MRIKMKTVMAGPEGAAYPGQEMDVSDGRGRALVAGGFATEIVIVSPPALETADAPPPDAPETLTEEELERATAPDAPETSDAPKGKRGHKGR